MNAIGSGTRVSAFLGLAVVGALVLTACNDSDSSDSAKTPPASAPAAPSQTAPTQAAPSSPSAPATQAAPSTPAATGPAAGNAPAPGGKDATPGQTFKIGEAAQVPFTFGSNKGTVSIAVTSIETGDPADLEPLKLGDKAKGLVPYYVHYTVTNTGTTDLSHTSVDHMKGLLADGTEAQDLLVIGTFAKCPSPSLPKGFTAGQSAQSCAVALAPTASKVTGAEYWGNPYSLGKNAVFWK
ncbi:hypothetical protein ACFVHB_02910 [Kitasatospora sp. NPDC127111]|uniref:hypothetical protein n=1 Tax=Kitasatospora sp. NPDC127111 TaxID=3345363 RepID=UPI00363251E8